MFMVFKEDRHDQFIAPWMVIKDGIVYVVDEGTFYWNDKDYHSLRIIHFSNLVYLNPQINYQEFEISHHKTFGIICKSPRNM